MKLAKTVNNIMIFILALWAVLSLVGAIFYGAYWHYFTALLCSGLSIALYKSKLD